jgi:hypothetical protein
MRNDGIASRYLFMSGIEPAEVNFDINLRLGFIHVGAAFQPRLSSYDVGATSFRGWKATPMRN